MHTSNTENREQTFDEKLEEILQKLSLTQQFLGEQFTSSRINDLRFQSKDDDARDEAKQAIKTLVRDTYYSRSFIKYSVGEEIGLYRITDRVARVGKNTKYRVVCIGCGAPMFRYSNKFKLPHKECPQRQIINPQKEVIDE